MKAILLDNERALRVDPQAQEIRRWEIVETNNVTRQLGAHREIAGKAVADLLAGLECDADATAVFGLLSAAITYLVLRSKTLDSYMGIELASDKGWRRWENAAASVIDALFPSREVKKGPS
jgi:hypothetical protein